MLSNNHKICPKCNKSRETYFTFEKDPQKKGRTWRIERCPKCGFNFEIEEVNGNEPKGKKDDEDDGRISRHPRGGWLV